MKISGGLVSGVNGTIIEHSLGTATTKRDKTTQNAHTQRLFAKLLTEKERASTLRDLLSNNNHMLEIRAVCFDIFFSMFLFLL